MKALFDFLPILLFFGTYKFYGIMTATAVAMGASVILAGWGWWRNGRPETMPLMSAGLILVFGGATLLLKDERFIKIKPTVLYGMLALVFAVSHLTRRTMAERMFAALDARVPRRVLARVNTWWVAFFSAVGALNYYVAARFDTDTWVNFKLFGLLGLTLAFVLVQAAYIARVAGTPEGAAPPEE